VHGNLTKLRQAEASIQRCVSKLQTVGTQDIKEAVKIVDAVREMIWNESRMRLAYENLRNQGFSAEDAVTEIALRHIECLCELSQSNSVWSKAGQ
jgi:hypothetical protein